VFRGGFGLYHNWIPLGEDNRVRQNPPGLITPTFRAGDPIPPVFALGTSDQPPFGFPFPTIPAQQLDSRGGLVGIRAKQMVLILTFTRTVPISIRLALSGIAIQVDRERPLQWLLHS